MRFTKMHGVGNDYVYINCFEEPIPPDPAELARTISDRHYGIGGDGLILICPSQTADARMRMFNADGSESEMCGNGIRCVAKYVYDHGISRKNTLRIETGRGILNLELEVANEKGHRVRVDMGEPVFETAKIPTRSGQSRGIDAEFQWKAGDGKPETSKITCVSMGNPHCVIFVDDLASAPVEAWGSAIETDPFFPKRTNVEFVQVQSPDRGRVRVWERGVGLTLACGTGACAVGVAGVLTGRFRRKTELTLPGGTLTIEWAPDNHVFMTGPAAFVCEGKFSC